MNEGVRPLYRSSCWKKEERALTRKKKSKNWYGKQFDSVLFVQSSPGELLKKEVQRIVKDNGFKVRVVEKGEAISILPSAVRRGSPSWLFRW